MIKLKSLIEDLNVDTFQMYHGGTRWIGNPEIRPFSKGNYEGGPGLYLTNNYWTARKYAKGGKVVHRVNVLKNYKDISKVLIPTEEMITFVKNSYGMRKKKNIIDDIISYSTRTNKKEISLEILNNLVVNHEAGSGNVGVEVSKFFVNKGGDASLQSQSGEEYWLVVFNPKIIVSVQVVDPNKVGEQDYILKL